jgi:hypothetical protein
MPDIPLGSGKPFEVFGQGMADLGVALGRLRAPAADKTLYNAGVYDEATTAKMELDRRTNEWYDKAKVDPDLATVIERWNTELPEMAKEILKDIKLPEAKIEFQKYLVTEADKSTENIRKVVSERKLVRIETTGRSYREGLAQRGQVGLLQQEWDRQTTTGIVSDSDVTAYESRLLPLARRQAALNDLSGVDYDTAIRATLANDFGKTYELDAAGVETVRNTIKDRKDISSTLTAEALKKSQDKITQEAVDGIAKGMLTTQRAEEIYSGLAGHGFQDNVRRWIDTKKADQEKADKLQIDYGQQGVYGENRIKLEQWDGVSEREGWLNKINALFQPQRVNDALHPNKIDQTQFNLLMTAYTQAIDDANSGKRRGPGFNDPAKESKLWKIAWNLDGTYKDTNAIHDAMTATGYLENGVSGEKWSEIWAKVDEFKGDDTKKRYVKEIGTAYGILLQQMIQNKVPKDQIFRTAAEEGIMAQRMINYMNANPGKPVLWDAERDNILGGKAAQEAAKQIVAQIGIGFPGFMSRFVGYGPGFTEETKLETLRTWAVETGTELNVAQSGAIEAAHPIVVEQEMQFLKENGIKNVTNSLPDSKGEMNYQTQSGEQYKVVQDEPYLKVGGVARFILYKVVNGKWTRQNWK